MADQTGTLSLQGIQLGTAIGSINQGPYSIPMSAITKTDIITAGVTNHATSIPAGASGCLVVANGVSGGTLATGFISNELTPLNPQYPMMWTFDTVTPNVPANIYTSVSSVTGSIAQMIIW